MTQNFYSMFFQEKKKLISSLTLLNVDFLKHWSILQSVHDKIVKIYLNKSKIINNDKSWFVGQHLGCHPILYHTMPFTPLKLNSTIRRRRLLNVLQVYRQVLQGNTETARRLLVLHIHSHTDPFTSVDELLKKMPLWTVRALRIIWMKECTKFSLEVLIANNIKAVWATFSCRKCHYHLLLSIYILWKNVIVHLTYRHVCISCIFKSLFKLSYSVKKY